VYSLSPQGAGVEGSSAFLLLCDEEEDTEAQVMDAALSDDGNMLAVLLSSKTLLYFRSKKRHRLVLEVECNFSPLSVLLLSPSHHPRQDIRQEYILCVGSHNGVQFTHVSQGSARSPWQATSIGECLPFWRVVGLVAASPRCVFRSLDASVSDIIGSSPSSSSSPSLPGTGASSTSSSKRKGDKKRRGKNPRSAEVETPNTATTIQRPSPIGAVFAASSDGRLGLLQVWSSNTGSRPRVSSDLGDSSPITSVNVRVKEEVLGSSEPTPLCVAAVWETEVAYPRPTDLALSPFVPRLAVCDWSGGVHLRDIPIADIMDEKTETCIWEWESASPWVRTEVDKSSSIPHFVVWSPNGECLAIAHDKVIQLRTTARPKQGGDGATIDSGTSFPFGDTEEEEVVLRQISFPSCISGFCSDETHFYVALVESDTKFGPISGVRIVSVPWPSFAVMSLDTMLTSPVATSPEDGGRVLLLSPSAFPLRRTLGSLLCSSIPVALVVREGLPSLSPSAFTSSSSLSPIVNVDAPFLSIGQLFRTLFGLPTLLLEEPEHVLPQELAKSTGGISLSPKRLVLELPEATYECDLKSLVWKQVLS